MMQFVDHIVILAFSDSRMWCPFVQSFTGPIVLVPVTLWLLNEFGSSPDYLCLIYYLNFAERRLWCVAAVATISAWMNRRFPVQVRVAVFYVFGFGFLISAQLGGVAEYF